jgi:FMN phosphatase YigB (HAD superfamily)
MITAILFDLDGTLLENDMDVFMPPYFRSLAARVAPLVAPDAFLNALMASTRAMMRPHSAEQTNEEVFWAAFIPRVGRSAAELRPVLDAFYGDDFARLKLYTVCKPAARTLVQAAFSANQAVAIATQPVFPLAAVQHRLDWAGVADFPYALITTYENMHTSKPDPAYYREICERIGHQPETCLMAGNDPDADIRPAAAAGLHTFWVTEKGEQPIPGLPAEHSGTLAALQRLIEGK